MVKILKSSVAARAIISRANCYATMNAIDTLIVELNQERRSAGRQPILAKVDDFVASWQLVLAAIPTAGATANTFYAGPTSGGAANATFRALVNADFPIALAPNITALTLGGAGVATGTLLISGTTSGVVTIQTQAAAGTYNFNLPTTAGTSGQVLASGGGGAAPMTWANIATTSGNTITVNGFTYTLQGATATLARTDAAQSFTGTQTFAGIQFGSGTVLSNYQEGTWTPTDNSGAGLTFTSIACDYTRIGNRVFITGNWTWAVTANANGASVSGLPLTSGTLTAGAYAGSPILTDLVSANWFMSWVSSNSALINLTNQSGSAGVTNATASGKVVRVSVVYHV